MSSANRKPGELVSVPTAAELAWLARGLRLKLSAMWLLLMLPVIAAAGVSWRFSPLMPLFAVLALAVLTDLTGRCCCLAFPVPQRVPLAGSIICQFMALFGGIAFAVAAGTFGIYIGLIMAVCLQFAAAYLFTVFLTDAAQLMHVAEVTRPIEVLQRRLWQTLSMLIATGVATTFILALIAVATLLFWVGGALLILPGGAVLALFLLALTLAVSSLFYHYGGALQKLRQAIDERLTTTDA